VKWSQYHHLLHSEYREAGSKLEITNAAAGRASDRGAMAFVVVFSFCPFHSYFFLVSPLHMKKEDTYTERAKESTLFR